MDDVTLEAKNAVMVGNDAKMADIGRALGTLWLFGGARARRTICAPLPFYIRSCAVRRVMKTPSRSKPMGPRHDAPDSRSAAHA